MELKAALSESKATLDELNNQLRSHKSQLAAWNKEISSKVSEQKRLRQEYLDSQLKVEQLGHDMDSVKNSGKSAVKQVQSVLRSAINSMYVLLCSKCLSILKGIINLLSNFIGVRNTACIHVSSQLSR